MGSSSTTYVSRKGHTYTAMFYSLGTLAGDERKDFHPTPTPALVFPFPNFSFLACISPYLSVHCLKF